MIPNIVSNQINEIIYARTAPTPLAAGEILEISDYAVPLGGSGFNTYTKSLVANFLPSAQNPYNSVYPVGNVQIAEPPKMVTYPAHNFGSAIPINAQVMRQCQNGGFSGFDPVVEGTEEIKLGWDKLIENVAVYGLPSEQIPGLLVGSNIPSVLDNANYFNNSLTGEQILDFWYNHCARVKNGSQFRYAADVLGLPSKLYQYLAGKTVNSAGSTRDTVLSVLEERAVKAKYISRIVECTSFDAGKFAALLPYDADLIGLGVIDLVRDDYNERIEFNGGTLGVVAEHPLAGVIIRLSAGF